MVQIQYDPFLTALAMTVGGIFAVFMLWLLGGRNWKTTAKLAAFGFLWFVSTAAIIKSGASTDNWTIDPTSKSGRVTNYDTAGRSVAFQSKRTYACAGTFTPAATPTDLVTITGPTSGSARLISVYFGASNTAAGSQTYFVIKRSTADTGGTFVAGTNVPLDAVDAAGTASCGHWTANPAALGTVIGNINVVRWGSPVLVPGSFAGVREDAGGEMLPWYDRTLLDKPVTLNAAAQQLAINFAGAALVAGQVHHYRIVWMEE